MLAGLTSRWGWYWVRGFSDPGQALKCKTQNSGLRSKEEKPRDPINQPSRCNAKEGLLSVVQTGYSDLLGGRAYGTANWASFICSMLHTGYKVIGYMFAKQSYCTNFAGFCSNLKQFYWYKRRGLLFKFKAILLVQTARAFFKLRRPRASQLSRGLFTGCTLIGRLQVTRWGRGIPPFHGNRNPSPGPLPAPAPATPHNKTFFLSFKNQQEKYQTHEL